MVSNTDESGCGVFVEFPLPEERIFRNQAMEDILLLLVRNPHQEFTVTELRNITGCGGDTVQTAIRGLTQADMIQTRSDGRKKLIRANRDRFDRPDDPILQISQEQFRTPVKAFVDRIEDQQDNLIGIILFGSVARGEADRTSDIDIQVIVEGDLLETRRELQDLRQEVEEQRFDGNRYHFQLLVESTETVEQYGDKLREIFSQGIVLYSTPRMKDVKEAVFHG